MAVRQAYPERRQQYVRTSSTPSQAYIYGSAAPKPVYEPERRRESPKRPKKQVSTQVRKNRRQALRMSPAYVIFLTIAAVLALIVCVNYVQLQSDITSRAKNIAAMQKELADMKEENNTRYNAIMDSVNLDEVREKAQTELGMVYATPEQIVTYDRPAADYVKQYEDIPEDGVLAQSDKNLN